MMRCYDDVMIYLIFTSGVLTQSYDETTPQLTDENTTGRFFRCSVDYHFMADSYRKIRASRKLNVAKSEQGVTPNHC